MSSRIRLFKNFCRIFFPFFAIPFLSIVWEIVDCGALGVIFTRINRSPWEYMKPVFWCCLIWWSLELLCGVKSFKVFVKGKLISLFLLCVFCCAVNLCFALFSPGFFWWQPVIFSSFLSLLFYGISNIAVKNIKTQRGFLALICLLAVMVAAVFCFSLYPPHWFLFMGDFPRL